MEPVRGGVRSRRRLNSCLGDTPAHEVQAAIIAAVSLIAPLERAWFRSVLLIGAAIPIAALYAWRTVVLPLASGALPEDFTVNYMAAAARIASGHNPYDLSAATRLTVAGPQYVTPLPVAWMLQPLLHASAATQLIVVLAVLQLSLVVFLVTTLRALGVKDWQSTVLLVLVAIAFEPVAANIDEGQINLVMLALSGVWLLGWVRGDRWVGSVARRSAAVPARLRLQGRAGALSRNRAVREPLARRDSGETARPRHVPGHCRQHLAGGTSHHAADLARGPGRDVLGAAPAGGAGERARAGGGGHGSRGAAHRELLVGHAPRAASAADAGAAAVGDRATRLARRRARGRRVDAHRPRAQLVPDAADLGLLQHARAAADGRVRRGGHHGHLGGCAAGGQQAAISGPSGCGSRTPYPTRRTGSRWRTPRGTPSWGTGG